ncbi:hypothetical protein CC85DRAFT_282080 [Cutaneotrichosporon oleaginosum]|uniref:G-patch domain-containing protein n=1 Tax=Cutaneotrichosporon oleaginosum TaxID=879819 RepID=A0A0J0XY29_9TREE|nr:uncharacterized protein CC85DRAFT_282080 [Cutaneotrichosporon oleaginosum]KLT45943.1 hypothetical protein CC85DRAFT_282080 [Cutaneotrichosporon oleaginosum]TXT06639.1 hypothetical protein COLE_05970 [Cutaneotrichosporon oleaginosum]
MEEDGGSLPGASRRGLGFFAPAVTIRSHTPSSWQDAGPAPRDWALWKEWNINPAGHGGRKGPPVFVLAESSYDDLGRSVTDGYQVDVEEGEKEKDREGKEDGASVADWYRSLASASVSKAASTASASPSPAPIDHPRQSATASAPASTPYSATSTSAPPSSISSPTTAPIRVHRSEWFIRRALVSAAKESPQPPPPPPTSSSIGSMLKIDTAKPAPPPIPRYALGPENVGFSRLAALGWGGGGLGRPEGWTEEDELRARERARLGRLAEDRPRSAPPEASGIVDLTGDSDEEWDEEEAIKHGPGRTMPIATALKFNRLGLGRVAADKRVSHSHAEIERARLRGAGNRHDGKSEPTKKAKVKWAERDRRDREHRARIAAALR